MYQENDPIRRASERRKDKNELKNLVTYQINKYTIKPAATILQQNQEEIVELLSQWYEEAPKNKLVDYIWHNIKLDSKFIEIKYLLAKIAKKFEINRLHEKELLEKMVQKRSANTDDSNAPPKRYMVPDHRPMDPVYVPPNSMKNEMNYGRVRLLLAAPKSNEVKNVLSPEEKTPSTVPTSNENSTKSSFQNGSKNDLNSTGSKSNHNSADFSSNSNDNSSVAQQLLSLLLQQSSSRNAEELKSTDEINSEKDTNSANRDNLQSPSSSPHPAANEIVENDDEEDEESEEDFHVSRPRDFSYYDRFSKSRQSRNVIAPQSCNQNNDENLFDEENGQSNDTVHSDGNESANNSERQSVIEEEENVESDDDIHSLRPRNFDRYRSTSTITNSRQEPPVEISIFYGDNDDDYEPPPHKRRKRIRFDEANAVDNEHTQKNIDERAKTLGTPLQPHETIDYEYKVNMEGPNPTENMVAFPNQRAPCRKPEYHILRYWIPRSDYNDSIENALSAFCKNPYVVDTYERSPEHLFIGDSMLSGIAIKRNFKKTEYINCGRPNNPFNIVDYLKTEIGENRNNYAIKNIFICIGLDFLTLDPDSKRATKNASHFLEEFLNQIIKAFDPNGPKRYKRVKEISHFNEDSFLAIVPPRLVLITIPQIKSYYYAFNKEILKMNKLIREFVAHYKEKKRLQLELYDWEMASEKYDQCNVEHLSKRNDILMNYLSKECAVFMFKPLEKTKL